jgi:hypothetical protein
MAITYDPIATTTLGSATSTITFSSIPATYTDLRLVFTCTTASGVVVFIRFNGDTASNYSRVFMDGEGTAANSASTTGSTTLRPMGNGSTSATVPTLITVDTMSYTGSTFKTSLCTFSGDKNGSGSVSSAVAMWRSTAAINSVLIFNSGAVNFSIGTTATLYGIKNA